MQTASRGEGGGAGKFGVYPGSSTFDLVKANAAAVQQLASGPASSCSKEGPAAAGPCADKGCGGCAWAMSPCACLCDALVAAHLHLTFA